MQWHAPPKISLSNGAARPLKPQAPDLIGSTGSRYSSPSDVAHPLDSCVPIDPCKSSKESSCSQQDLFEELLLRKSSKRSCWLQNNSRHSEPGACETAHAMQHSCSHYNEFRSITWQTGIYLCTWQDSMATLMQPFPCNLQLQITKRPITAHAQTQAKQLEATVTLRQKKKSKPSYLHPQHAQGAFHPRLQPHDTGKHKVSCPGFLPKRSA